LNPVTIRPYRPEDRDRLRKIALDTADLGYGPGDDIPIKDTLADILTRYYTDFEPESAWVADTNGLAVGYIIGSIHPRRHHSVMRSKIVPSAIMKAIADGGLWSPGAWRLLLMATTMLGSNPGKDILDKYPAHLHINIDENYRDGGTGRLLVSTFEDYVRNADIRGIHARVRGNNTGAGKFFSSLGYTPVFESRTIKTQTSDGNRMAFKIVTYAKKIDNR
jgi:ribosomal protein S18 acetylase RimI-like enzyme